MSSVRATATAVTMALLAIGIVGGHAIALASADVVTILVVASVYALVCLTVFVLPRGGVSQGGMGPALAALVLVGPSAAIVGVGVGSAFAGLANRDRAAPDVTVMEAARQPIALAVSWLTADTLGILNGYSTTVSPLPQVLHLLALGIVIVIVEIISFAIVDYLAMGTRPLRSILNLGRMLASAYLGQASVAAVLVLVYPTLGVLSVVVLASLMLLMKHSFSLYLRVHTAYSKTVGVLARLAEFERRETRGHSERVADLSAQIGRTMGFSYSDLETLSMAALLHDIGVVKPSSVEQGSPESHALVGSKIVSQIDRLAMCAPLIERVPADFCDTGRSREDRMSQVIRVASDYDQALLGSSGVADSSRRSIESLREQAGVRYDPEVLDALEAVIGG